MEDSAEQEDPSAQHDAEIPNAGHGCRLVVLHLLNEGVYFPHPSLAHFLLGFNIQAPLSK